MAETRRLDETVDRNRGVPHRPEHEEVDGAVLFLHKDYEPPTFRALDPWELQIEHICRSISKRTGLLRRLGCHPHGLTCSTARLAACTLTDAVSIINSEVWSSSCPEDHGKLTRFPSLKKLGRKRSGSYDSMPSWTRRRVGPGLFATGLSIPSPFLTQECARKIMLC